MERITMCDSKINIVNFDFTWTLNNKPNYNWTWQHSKSTSLDDNRRPKQVVVILHFWMPDVWDIRALIWFVFQSHMEWQFIRFTYVNAVATSQTSQHVLNICVHKLTNHILLLICPNAGLSTVHLQKSSVLLEARYLFTCLHGLQLPLVFQPLLIPHVALLQKNCVCRDGRNQICSNWEL